MSLPAGWTLIHCSGTYLNMDGSPAEGYVQFESSYVVTVAGQVVVPRSIVCKLDATGSFAIDLPSTNDPTISPQGWTYNVTERLNNGQGRSFAMLALFDGGAIDMATVVPPITPPALVNLPDYAAEAEASAASASLSATSAAASAAAAGLGPNIGYATKALMDADLAHGDGTLAVVTNDATPANNTMYRKSGASGAGSWVVSADRVSVLETEVAGLEVTNGVLVDGGLAKYSGSGPVHPIVVDKDRRVLLGLNAATNELEGPGLVNPAESATIARDALGSYGAAAYGGSTLYPVLIDQNRTVLLGYDVVNRRIVGAGLGSSGGGGAAASGAPPLATADVPAIKAVNHMLFGGQSLSVGALATTLLSTTQPYSNITFHGGPRAWDGAASDFSAFKPLVEDAVAPSPDGGVNRGETCCSGAANYASTLMAVEEGISPSTHVILASTGGKGGTVIDDLDKGSAWYNSYFITHVSGAHALNSNHAVHTFNWIQGENDSGITSFATYASKMNALQADVETDVKAITGQTSPVFMLTYQTRAWYNINAGAGDTQYNSDVALAQLNCAQTNSRIFMVSPIYHMPRADGTHLTNAGYKWLGAYFGRAYKRLVVDHVEPQWLNPLSATRRGNVIRVRFDVPVAPMVLDTTSMAPTTNCGFAVQDTVGILTISGVAVDGADVVLTLASTPVGTTQVRYALDYMGTGLTINNGMSGNLRDSAPEIITISGTDFPLHNVAPSFQLPVIALGE